MRPLELAVIYGVMGLIVAVTLQWRGRPGALVSLVAWPLLLPGLWSAPPPVEVAPAIPPAPGLDPVERAIDSLAQAVAEGPPLPGEADCVAAVGAARRGLRALAERAGALQAVVDRLPPGASTPGSHPHAQLRALRDEAAGRLAEAVAAVDDLTARVLLARFTGAEPADLGAALDRLAQAADSAAEVSRLASTASASAPQQQGEHGQRGAAAAASARRPLG